MMSCNILYNLFQRIKPCSTNKLCPKTYSSSHIRNYCHQLQVAVAMKTLDESDVGIFCYISQLSGFRGILKHRYSDFIVNEVDLDGNVVHLTSLEASPEIVEDKKVKIPEESNKSYADEIESFRALAGDSDADSLKAFVDQIHSGVDDDIEAIVLSPSSDKSHRTAIHQFFKEKLNFLVTDTVDGPESSLKCIRVRLNSGGNNGKNRNSKKRKVRSDKCYDDRGSDNWPEHVGKFVRFHLYKENKDTQEALGLIGKMLGVQPRSFGFAGTKDKRSVSTQRVTVFKQRASRLAALNERLIGIKVGDFRYVKEGLLLGQLLGNRFTVTLRGVVADSEDIIKASANALAQHGFINYFGLQRFGSGSVPTHLIGAALLRGEWKSAVCLILDPREGEKEATRKVREYYKETNDIEKTLRQLPRYMLAERAILTCLKKCPGNYLQVLKAIPRTLRMMYVHSYQSYLWNHAASMRVQKHGINQLVLGDLVYCSGECPGKVTGASASDLDDNSYLHTDDCSHLDETSDTVPTEKAIPVKNCMLPSHDLVGKAINIIKIGIPPDGPYRKVGLIKSWAVTEEDLLAGNYTVDDLVLPLPGSRIIYPTNDIANVYHDLAGKDAVSLVESVHNVKEFSITSMTGGYRRVFQKLKDYEWELLTYTDGNRPLVETDLDMTNKSRRTTMGKKYDLVNGFDCSKQSKNFENDTMPSTDDYEAVSEQQAALQQPQSRDGSNAPEAQKALKMSFTLPTSSYATMAIRELLKTSTSVAFHKTLNQ